MKGYVYALINPSLVGLVKIGKTTRTPKERALELSSSTGVPTPFVVGYEIYVSNCNKAETYLHRILESNGFRVADNREFFRVELKDIIDVFLECQKKYQIKEEQNNKFDGEQHIEDIVDEADLYYMGQGGVFQDDDRAQKMYIKAFNLGSYRAASRLAEIYFVVNPKKHIEYLQKSIEFNKKYTSCKDVALIILSDAYIDIYRNYGDKNLSECMINDLTTPRFMFDDLITPRADYRRSLEELYSAYVDLGQEVNVKIALDKIFLLYRYSYNYILEVYKNFNKNLDLDIDTHIYFYRNTDLSQSQAKICFHPLHNMIFGALYFLKNYLKDISENKAPVVDLNFSKTDCQILFNVIIENYNSDDISSFRNGYAKYQQKIFGNSDIFVSSEQLIDKASQVDNQIVSSRNKISPIFLIVGLFLLALIYFLFS